MSNQEVECPKCRSRILADKLAHVPEIPCYGCGNILSGTIFPALYQRKAEKPTLSNPATGEDAVCFYRADQRATAVCAQCGVFVSEMYRVRIGDDDYCTNCVAKSRTEDTIPALITRSTLRDYQALFVAIVPLILFFPVAVVTGPYSLYLALRYWKKPGGIIQRTNWRFGLAIFCAAAQILGAVGFAYMVWQESV